jgi:hypothetical protein
MKSLISTFILVLATIILNAQVSENRELLPFKSLRVTNQVNVFLSQGNNPIARVEASGIDLSDVITEVNQNILEVTLRSGVYTDFRVDVYLTFSEIHNIFVTSSGRVSVQNVIKGDSITLNANTSAEINAQIDHKKANLSAYKGGSIRLMGSVGSYDINVRSGGIISALDLKADKVNVEVSTKGMAKVFATESIEGRVRLGGSLTISGEPKLRNIKTSLGGTILEQ